MPFCQKLAEPAQRIAADLRKTWNVFYDDSGNIGRRYRRQDEVGTPYCVTLDFESASDGRVTIRDRDSMEQARVPQEGVAAWLLEQGRLRLVSTDIVWYPQGIGGRALWLRDVSLDVRRVGEGHHDQRGDRKGQPGEPASHAVGSTSLIPTPYTVSRYLLSAAVSPSFLRSHEMCTSTVFSDPP